MILKLGNYHYNNLTKCPLTSTILNRKNRLSTFVPRCSSLANTKQLYSIWCNVGPASKTLVQHCTNVIHVFCVHWEVEIYRNIEASMFCWCLLYAVCAYASSVFILHMVIVISGYQSASSRQLPVLTGHVSLGSTKSFSQ